MTYHIVPNGMSPWQVAWVTAAASVWNGGAGLVNRGIDWTFSRGSDATQMVADNGQNELAMLTSLEIGQFGYDPAAMGFRMGDQPVNGCAAGTWENDIVLNADYTWTTNVPSQLESGEESIQYVAMHEFGHALGFVHDNDIVGVMTGGGGSGGGYHAGDVGPGVLRLS